MKKFTMLYAIGAVFVSVAAYLTPSGTLADLLGVGGGFILLAAVFYGIAILDRS